MSFPPSAAAGCATDACPFDGRGVFVGAGVSVEVGVAVGLGVGEVVAGKNGVGDGMPAVGVAVGMTVGVDISVAVGRGVSVGFNSPTGNQDRMGLSCEEAGVPWLAAEAEEPVPGQKNQTATRHTASTNTRIGMETRMLEMALGGDPEKKACPFA